MATLLTRRLASSLVVAATFSALAAHAEADGLLGLSAAGWPTGNNANSGSSTNPAGAATRANPASRAASAAGRTAKAPGNASSGPHREVHKYVATVEFCIIRPDGKRMWFNREYATHIWNGQTGQWVPQDWKKYVQYQKSMLNTGGNLIVDVKTIRHTQAVVVY